MAFTPVIRGTQAQVSWQSAELKFAIKIQFWHSNRNWIRILGDSRRKQKNFWQITPQSNRKGGEVVRGWEEMSSCRGDPEGRSRHRPLREPASDLIKEVRDIAAGLVEVLLPVRAIACPNPPVTNEDAGCILHESAPHRLGEECWDVEHPDDQPQEILELHVVNWVDAWVVLSLGAGPDHLVSGWHCGDKNQNRS